MMDIASDVLRAIETHSGLAAWVQAIGAIISLWAAIIIPRQAQWYDALFKVKSLQFELIEFVNLARRVQEGLYFGRPKGAVELRDKAVSVLIPAAIKASNTNPSALKTRRQMKVLVDASDWAVKARWDIDNALSRPTVSTDTLGEQKMHVEKAVRDAEAGAATILFRMKKEFRF